MSENNIFKSFLTGLFRGIVVGLILFILIILMYFFLPASLKEYIFMDSKTEQDALIGGSFELLGKNGKIYTYEDFLGKPLLVFFGFTSCPDICPYGLSIIGEVLHNMEKDLEKINAIFITLDPERDNYSRTSEFVESFHPHIIGLSGSTKKIEEAVLSWKVYRKIVDLKSSELDYTIDHSAHIYLMDKFGKYLAHFSHNEDPNIIVKKIKTLF